LGLGLPWAYACTYWKVKYDRDYEVPAGPLKFSVLVFLVVAVICFAVLITRRFALGGELGGLKPSKYLSAAICIMLWVIYQIITAM